MAAAVLLAAALWTLLCAAVELLPGRSRAAHDVKNRCVSIVHGQLGLLLALRCLWARGAALCAPSSAGERRAVAVSLGYFLYDLCACLLLGLGDGDLLAHHALAIAGLASALASAHGAPAALLGLLAAELSNLPMHLRQILRLRGRAHTALFALSERLYLLSYLAARATLCPLSLLLALRCAGTPWPLRLSCLLLAAQSFRFFPRMLAMLRRGPDGRAGGVF